MWAWTGINVLSSFLGMGASDDDTYYSPTNVTYEGDNVYINGQPSGSTEQYYQQAQELAARAQQQNYSGASQQYAYPPQNSYGDPSQNYVPAPGQNYVRAAAQNYVPPPTQNYASAPTQNYALAPGQNFVPPLAPNYAAGPQQNYASGPPQNYAVAQQADSSQLGAPQPPPATNEQFQPLGVFALAAPGQDQSDMLIQLAINQSGTLRGNYLNNLTSETSQVYGTLDKKTKRVSWTVGTNLNTVFDTSLSDLTKDDSEVLVHYGPNNTRQMALIRMPAPSEPTETRVNPQYSSL